MATTTATRPATESKFRARLAFLIKGISRQDPLARRALLSVAMVVGGVLVAFSGLIHLRLWQMSYRHIPTIGPLFIVQGIAGFMIGAAIVGFRRLHKAAIGAGYMAASLVGLVLSIKVGLFGFKDSLKAPFAGLSLGVEIVGLVVLVAVAVAVARSGKPSSEEQVTQPAEAAAPVRQAVAPPARPLAPRALTPVLAGAGPIGGGRSGSSSWQSGSARQSLTAPGGVPRPEAVAGSPATGRGGSSSWRSSF